LKVQNSARLVELSKNDEIIDGTSLNIDIKEIGFGLGNWVLENKESFKKLCDLFLMW
jgi:hypothetical protein